MKKTEKRKKDSAPEIPNVKQARQPGSAGSERSRSQTGKGNTSARVQATVRVIVRPQTEEEARRFDVATDLLLADIVRRVMEQTNTKRDGTEETTG